MEKYLQDRAWSMLPCKYREEVKRLYDEFKDVSDRYKDVPCLSDADRRSSDRNIGHQPCLIYDTPDNTHKYGEHYFRYSPELTERLKGGGK